MTDYDRDFAGERFAQRLPVRHPISGPVVDRSRTDKLVFWTCAIAFVLAWCI